MAMDERLLARVRALVEWAEERGLAAFAFRDGDFRLEVRTPAARAATNAVPVVAAAAVSGNAPAEAPTLLPTIDSPLVGVFYRSPAPDAPPFVEAGAWVAPDTVIGLVEAMKVFNEITADTTGRIVRILVESGQMVTAGQPLMEVEPGSPQGRGTR